MSETRGGACVAVSLKAYFSAAQTLEWCRDVVDLLERQSCVSDGFVRVIVLPSFPLLPAVISIFEGSRVEVGAQDLHWEGGSTTGAVSPSLLAELGCSVVEVGHAERRRLGDDEKVVARKTAAAIEVGLTPLICVGETQPMAPSDAAREALRQFHSALSGADPNGVGRLIVGYEPVWAIGADTPAPTSYVNRVAAAMRRPEPAAGMGWGPTLLYGGSAGPGLLNRLDTSISGLFLGRLGHAPNRLLEVVEEAGQRQRTPVPEG